MGFHGVKTFIPLLLQYLTLKLECGSHSVGANVILRR